MKIKDRLMLYITLGVLGFIGLVLVGEYAVIMYSQSQTGEVIGTEPDVIALVQNALVGLIGIIGGYFGGKASKEDQE
jgi:predicted MFS family arabinose efflux permease